jgi:DNA polymerase-3 subunit epsilon
MLQDRVLVAHNAQFDYDFLAHEFTRARMWVPVSQRLCTLALSRQVDPPTHDMKLGTLAAHYGVPQQRAHDALDDTRVLAGVLRASLREAARLDLPLPLVSCPPRAESQFTPKPPKTPCAYRNPGRLGAGGPLQQGMKIAITGETAHARAELVGRAVSAGLNMMTSVSRHTSVLVTNEPAAASAKARRALAEGVPVIDEPAFLQLLADVRPGTTHEATAARAVSATGTKAEQVGSMEPVPTVTSAVPAPEAAALAPASPRVPVPAPRRSELPAGDPAKPLGGRRVLVLGGVHVDAAAARTRVVELGGSAAINLSASVTDVVLLPGGEGDRRMKRITALELPVHDPDWLASPASSDRNAVSLRPQEPHVMPRGGVIDLHEEMDEGLHQVLTAKVRSELMSAVASLPVETAGSTSTIAAAGGRIRRRGAWRVPRSLKVESAVGKVHLDLSRAVIEHAVVDIELRLGTGGARITVPRDAIVDVENVRTGWKDLLYKPQRHPRPGGPTIRISGAMGYGRLRIRHARR